MVQLESHLERDSAADGSWFGGCRRHCVAIVDVVSRYWIHFLPTPGLTDTQVKALFASALEDQGLLDLLTPERVDLALDDPRRPILVAGRSGDRR